MAESSGIAYCLGVDPGSVSGAVACVNGDGSQCQAWPLAKMTEHDLWEVFSVKPNEGRTFAVLEKVSSMPKQGIASAFKFGESFGLLRMALVAAGIEFELVTPRKWQAVMGCLSGGDKRVTKTAAQRLFPREKITHKTADALLLAEYARRLATERGLIASQPND
jgi:crossover junction endodeoxyribonuclease RuvC